MSPQARHPQGPSGGDSAGPEQPEGSGVSRVGVAPWREPTVTLGGRPSGWKAAAVGGVTPFLRHPPTPALFVWDHREAHLDVLSDIFKKPNPLTTRLHREAERAQTTKVT